MDDDHKSPGILTIGLGIFVGAWLTFLSFWAVALLAPYLIAKLQGFFVGP